MHVGWLRKVFMSGRLKISSQVTPNDNEMAASLVNTNGLMVRLGRSFCRLRNLYVIFSKLTSLERLTRCH